MAGLSFDFSKNKKETAIAIALGALILFVAYLAFLLVPQAGAAASALQNAAKLSAEVRIARADIARIDSLKTELAGYDAKIGRYIKMLPVEKEIPAFLESLAAMARDARVQIVGIAPSAVQDAESQKGRIYQEMPVQISARCGFHELGRFLANIEQSDRFIKVIDVDIRGNKGSPKKHDVELVLLTYVLLQGK